nr:hypothetical protein GCM10020092_032190 [Actinoplanes digitatis]
MVTGSASGRERRVVLVFPGQGAQWAGMGRDLLGDPVFAGRLHECAEALAPYTDWSLTEALGDSDLLERVDVVQPALWAVMVSLAAVWQAHGVRPAAVLGHSQGEIAAACVSGALSLADGARVVALRSRAIAGALSGLGGMASIAAPRADVDARLAGFGGRLSVAAVNGPGTVAVSGDPDALDELVAACVADGLRARRIPVDYASHSAHVERIRDLLLVELKDLAPRAGDIAFLSTVTADWADTTGLDAGYWYENLRRTVRLEESLAALIEQGHDVFVECSPHPVLTGSIEDTAAAAGADAVVIGTLRRDDGGRERLLVSLAEAHVRGVAVDWTPAVAGGRIVGLPTYAFQRERYWLEPAARRDPSGLDSVVHLVGGAGTVLTGRIGVAAQPWLAAHRLGDRVVVPGTAYLEWAVRVGDEAGLPVVAELDELAPMVLDTDLDLQVVVAADGGFTVHARPDAGHPWTRHATGRLAADPAPVTADGAPVAVSVPAAGGFRLHPDLLQGALAADGLPTAWRGVTVHATGATRLTVRTARNGDGTIAVVAVDAARRPGGHRRGRHGHPGRPDRPRRRRCRADLPRRMGTADPGGRAVRHDPAYHRRRRPGRRRARGHRGGPRRRPRMARRRPGRQARHRLRPGRRARPDQVRAVRAPRPLPADRRRPRRRPGRRRHRVGRAADPAARRPGPPAATRPGAHPVRHRGLGERHRSDHRRNRHARRARRRAPGHPARHTAAGADRAPRPGRARRDRAARPTGVPRRRGHLGRLRRRGPRPPRRGAGRASRT